MLDEAAIHELRDALDNPDYRPEIVPALIAIDLPEQVVLGRQFRLAWAAEDTELVTLVVVGQAPRELPPRGSCLLSPDACGPMEIELELWSATDLEAGCPGYTERFAIQVLPRPLRFMVQVPPAGAPIGSPVKVAWSIRNARRVELRHAGRRVALREQGILEFKMPALRDLVQLVAIDDAGVEHVRNIDIEPARPACRLPLAPLPLPPLRGSLD